MTIPTALTSLACQQAFLKLDSATRMWIQMKAQQFASIGRFGPTEINSLKQQVILRFGPSATTGSPCLVEIASWLVLQTMAQKSVTASTAVSSAGSITTSQLQNMDLQNNPRTQQQLLQTLSNVSRQLHDTSQSIISNLR